MTQANILKLISIPNVITTILSVPDLHNCDKQTPLADGITLNIVGTNLGDITVSLTGENVGDNPVEFKELDINHHMTILETIQHNLRAKRFKTTPPLVLLLEEADFIEIDGTYIHEFNFDLDDDEWNIKFDVDGGERDLTFTTTDLQSAIRLKDKSWHVHTENEAFTFDCFKQIKI